MNLGCAARPALCLLLVAGSALAGEASPPPVTLPHTELRTLPSQQVKGVTYKLYVSLPKDYATSGRSYPVVYLLDADYSFAIARNVVEHLSERNNLRELILVGIAYDGPLQYRLNRTRDYTPHFSPTGGYGPEYQQHSGGGPAFRRFLAEELLPFVQRSYRTGPERTLVGHSYGGLFTTWVAFSEPALFTHYLIVSPSLWYDGRFIFGMEEAFAKRQRRLPARMFFSVGAREGNAERDMVQDLRRFARQVERRGYQGLSTRAHVFDEENHNSVFPAALSRGLRFLHAP
ncbi:MAG TPA: alpha/beta hydrolase-fold protein [Aggregicoccus sp.]|nr:alpha/beta hydrolase-fold protein [Aggregicoccus sp.]